MFKIFTVLLVCVSTSESRILDISADDEIPHPPEIMYGGGTIRYKDPTMEVVSYDTRGKNLPKTFDARTHWKKCANIINTLRDQGNCGDCWAHVVSAVFSDRVCIHSNNQNKQVILSAYELTTCCNTCWASRPGGCEGGYIPRGFKYYINSGTVSGYHGLRPPPKGCQPWKKNIYNHAHFFTKTPTAECRRHCYNANFSKTFEHDKVFASRAYNVRQDPEDIQFEIMQNGPVAAGIFGFTEEFEHHKMEVYYIGPNATKSESEHAKGHAIKIIGWGVQRVKGEKIPYWLIVNSWGTRWGDKGTCKIRRGTNEVEIEEYISTVLPKEDFLHSIASRNMSTFISFFVFLTSVLNWVMDIL